MVVGSNGFIGRHLVRALREAGAETIAATRRDFDLSDVHGTREAIERAAPRQVVNLARVGGHHPGGGRAERDTTRTLLAATALAGCERYVHLGSGLEYGSAATDIDDDTPLRPDTDWGRGKAEATELVASADGDGVRTVVLRPFMVYGPGEPRRRLITSAAEAALEGRTLPMTRTGLRRDWVFVEDVAEAIVIALGGTADGEQVNLASGTDSANEEVATLAASAAGAQLRFASGHVVPRPWDVPRQKVSPAKAERVLGWKATTTLQDGIARTVEPLLRRAGRAAGVR